MAGRYTFWKLLDEREIVIPVIQRDYAQGRDSAKIIRNEFLSSIEDALINHKPLDLNFVYGSTEDKKRFIPIDGQQRLTTLFLLHLYLIHATGKDPAVFERLRNFKYLTRMTSTYFCNEIVSKRIEVPDHCAFRDIKDLKQAIIDNSWFGTSWQNDPTVDGMLNMLDAIHKMFGSRDDLEKIFASLCNEEECPLFFWYFDLGEYHLEDSIYIKMNARGKALTDFENFKAVLEKFLDEKDVPERGELAVLLDREWTEFFWKLVSDDEKQSESVVRFDDKMMNFIMAYICNEIANYTTETKREILRRDIKEILSLSKTEFTGRLRSFSARYMGGIRKTEDSFVEMFKVFSLMVRDNQIVEYASSDHRYRHEEKIFMDILDDPDNLSFEQRVWFYAWAQYLLNHIGREITQKGMEEWLRVAEHLINGQFFSGREEYVHVIKGFHWLAEYSDDIVSYLCEVGSRLDSVPDSEETGDAFPYFNKYILREECIKAQLMKLSPEWNAAIRETESNEYFNGQISAILEFAGIMTEKDAPSAWDNDKQLAYFTDFKKYADYLCKLFVPHGDKLGGPGLNWKIGNVFRRALLTKGDFTLKHEKLNSSFLINPVEQYSCSWKRLLRPQRDREIAVKRSYLKALLDDPLFDISDVNESCDRIIAAYECTDPEYRYFIKIPEVMAFVIGEGVTGKSKQCWNFFRNDYHTKFLLYTTRLNGYSLDYYKYALLLLLKREGAKNVKYSETSGVDNVLEKPVALFVNDNRYEINRIHRTKQYRIIGGKETDAVDEIRDTLEDMVQFVKDKGLLC